MITQDEVKQLFEYNLDTGVFLWRVSRKGSKGKGKEAGTVAQNGYRDVCIDGKKYGLHRLAFMYVTGDLPRCVDHINGIKSDNRWINLRSATYNQNGYNYAGTGSKTGFKNVYYDPRGQKKYFVALVVNGVRKSFGYYQTPEEASEIATKQRVVHHQEYAHHGLFNEIERA
jgi:hypothetical protein